MVNTRPRRVVSEAAPALPSASNTPAGRRRPHLREHKLESPRHSNEQKGDGLPEMEGPGSKMVTSEDGNEGGHPQEDGKRAPIAQLCPHADLDVAQSSGSETRRSPATSVIVMSTIPRRVSKRTRKIINDEESAPTSPVPALEGESHAAAGPSRSEGSGSPGASSSRPSLRIKLKVPEAVRQPAKRGGRRGGRSGRGRGKGKDGSLTFTLPARSQEALSEASSHHSVSRTPSSRSTPESEDPEDADGEVDSDPDAAPADNAMEVDGGVVDVESEGGDDEDEDSEVLPGNSRSRLTMRQAVLASMVSVEHVKLGSSTSGRKKQLTAEEAALRREETARKRKNMNEKKLEDEKTETINRLLKKQSSRSRAKRNAMLNSSVVPTPQSPHSGDEGESDGGAAGAAVTAALTGAFRRSIPAPAFRWISNSSGIQLGIPAEVLTSTTIPAPPSGEGEETEPEIKFDFPKLDDIKPKTPALCDVPGCGAFRKYRLVTAFDKGACGMEHLKVLKGKQGVGY